MLLSWNIFVSAPGLLMLAAMGAAVEVYDEAPAGDLDLMYPEINFIDTGLEGTGPEYEEAIKSVLLYKMLNSFRNQDVSPSVLSGPKWVPSNPALVPPDAFNILHMKTPSKRVSAAKLTPKEGYKYAQRPQQKWKIKKGKDVTDPLIVHT